MITWTKKKKEKRREREIILKQFIHSDYGSVKRKQIYEWKEEGKTKTISFDYHNQRPRNRQAIANAGRWSARWSWSTPPSPSRNRRWSTWYLGRWWRARRHRVCGRYPQRPWRSSRCRPGSRRVERSRGWRGGPWTRVAFPVWGRTSGGARSWCSRPVWLATRFVPGWTRTPLRCSLRGSGLGPSPLARGPPSPGRFRERKIRREKGGIWLWFVPREMRFPKPNRFRAREVLLQC